MRINPFLNINKATKTNEQEKNEQQIQRPSKLRAKVNPINVNRLDIVPPKDRVVHDIREYVKQRIELGILSPIELTDVYGLSVYVGMVLPEKLEFDLENEVVQAEKGDFIIFDFDNNISYVQKDNFRSFYRMSKASKEQQLLSAIRLFNLNTTAEQLTIKETLNESARASEDKIFSELTEQIMNGKVDKRLLDAYQRIIESKYKNELINYTALSGFKAKYFMSLLKRNGVPFALLTPLVDSIVDTENDEFDVEKITAINNYTTLIATLAYSAHIVADVLEETNYDLEGKAHCVDGLSLEELISFKAQMDGLGISIPGTTADKVLAQMRQEVLEQVEMYGAHDILARDDADIIK